MKKIAVVTDTNSGMTQEEAEKYGISLLPMPFIADGKNYFEGVNCSYKQFFKMLEKGAKVSTSQPSPAEITALWDNLLLRSNEYILHIPMSSALSSSYSTACMLAKNYDGKVIVADNKRISVSQRQSAIDAVRLARRGFSAYKIKNKLEEMSYNASVYIAVNTLELLKKGGRITAAGASIASILGLKPILQIQGEKLDAYSKGRGMAKAQEIMLKAIQNDLSERFAGRKIHIETAYSGDIKPALAWQKKVQEIFPEYKISCRRLPISICCHTGAGALGIGCVEYIE